ncbi:calmodulin-lysine N-methyltransferase-like [Pecten maximus]|uniref:calmodulin-lysine N-methyltransferase-like n=1 Tax=Pecten maximus TaxID=6579 RepID=UPI001458BC8F|nr:calmodulin-lysine N-methyltransferase-like [Pecten maximus]
MSTQLNRSEKARERWKLLAKALKGERSDETCQSTVSVRRFGSYSLLQTQELSTPEDVKNCGSTWHRYTCPEVQNFSMTIRHLAGTIKPETVFGFNNTGNVCVWPSEEVMAYHTQTYLNDFSGAAVCELGGGMTCLAGVMLSILSDAESMLLTDGNEESVDNLNKIIENNSSAFGKTKVTSRMLRWGSGPVEESLVEKFDIILCADCLFFDEGRKDLVDLVYTMLKPKGKVLMYAPRRGKTFDQFVTLAGEKFHTTVKEEYDPTVWSLHKKMDAKGLEHYDANIHFPLFLSMERINEAS